ncbi:MAG: hypothetical protein OEW35_16565 [Gammaproteobacteria bacterium]|nr:hypothetical protein [Gammaproteobacteria bacterium]MDH4255125.1 hypothetical protein [Gammaproteobacteria bacterium]MDH5310806.1 hypothetical protein [Gammaproteobacteria bacterium]
MAPTLHRFSEILLATGLALAVSACPRAEVPAEAPAEVPAGKGNCGPGSMLRVELHGSVTASIDWQGPTLDCGGMPRPEGQGARLQFGGSADPADPERRLTFIIALPGLERGAPAAEIPATVTLIEEERGRFYSSAELEICWADVSLQMPDDSLGPNRYRISGLVYCVAPLAEQNGTGGVSFTDLRYSGWLEWSSPQ